MGGSDIPLSSARDEPWLPPTIRGPLASTFDNQPRQNENRGDLGQLDKLSKCQELRVDDNAGPSGSESGHSDFATIITVDDMGFGASWPQQVQKYSFRDYSLLAHGLPQTTNDDGPRICERQMSVDEVTLTSVGDQFPQDSPGPHRTPGEMVDSFTEELKDEMAEGERKTDSITHDEIQNKLMEVMESSKHNDTEFVPQDQLLTTIDDHNVKRLLRYAFPNDDDRQIDEKFGEICGKEHRRSRRMILATLLLINKVVFIEDFIRKDIRDIHLPLVPCDDNHRYVYENAFFRKNDTALTSFLHRRHTDMRPFFRNQYHVLAPFFDIKGDRVCFYKLDLSIPLPFLEYHREQDGGHGSVWKVKIHPAHHNFKGEEFEPNPYFAVKEIYSDNYERYRDEVQVLERWSGSNTCHPHLIRLLMTFQHGRKYYLVFPWATGNLVTFWKSNPLPPKSLQSIRWIMAQCLGMADGLKKIHHHRSWPSKVSTSSLLGVELLAKKILGRHGDIKPENVLWFDQDERLVIADFGLTRFHSSDTDAVRTTPDKLRGVSRTYRPPEIDLDFPLLQRYDVWSLGCLYLEFITWYLVGYEMTRGEGPGSFQQERISDDRKRDSPIPEDKFFNLFPNQSEPAYFDAEVKDSVRRWILKLRGLEDCSQCISEFLDMIESYMLVPNHHSRDEMRQIHRKLKEIEKQCRTSDEYCINRVQKTGSRRSSLAQPAMGKLRQSMVIQDCAKPHRDPKENGNPEGNLDTYLEKTFQDLYRENSLGDQPMTGPSKVDSRPGIRQRPSSLPPTPSFPAQDSATPAGRRRSGIKRFGSFQVMPRLDSDETAMTVQDDVMSVKDTSSSLNTTPFLTPEHSLVKKSSSNGQGPAYLPNIVTPRGSSDGRSVDGTSHDKILPIPNRDKESLPFLSALNNRPSVESRDHGRHGTSSHSAASNTNGSDRTSYSHLKPQGQIEKDIISTSGEGQPGSVRVSQSRTNRWSKDRFKAKYRRIFRLLQRLVARG